MEHHNGRNCLDQETMLLGSIMHHCRNGLLPFSCVLISCLLMLLHVSSAKSQPVPKPRPSQTSTSVYSNIQNDTVGSFLNVIPRPRPANIAVGYQAAISSQLKPKTAKISPALVSLPTGIASTVSTSKSGTLKQALGFLRKNKRRDAIAIYNGMNKSLDRDILLYSLVIHGPHGLTPSQIQSLAKRRPVWARSSTYQKRIEQTLVLSKPSNKVLLRAFGNVDPVSDEGRIAYAKALIATGQKTKARTISRTLWTLERQGIKEEARVYRAIGKALTKKDHSDRADYLLYYDRAKGAERLTRFLSRDEKKLIAARAAVARRSKNALNALKAVPASLRNRPGYMFSLGKYYRRSGQLQKAAQTYIRASTDKNQLTSPLSWWKEKRLLARMLLEKREFQLAYQVVARRSELPSRYASDAEFEAGWIALRFNRNARVAIKHMDNSWRVATRRSQIARGLYWLARAYDAAGDKSNALAAYNKGADPTSYYGLLSLETLGRTTLNFSRPPVATDSIKNRFSSRPAVKAIKRYVNLGHGNFSRPIIRQLARQTNDSSEMGLIWNLAMKSKEYRAALQVGIIAKNRKFNVDALLFPTAPVPKSANTSGLGRALILALARQESGFDHTVISSANARGFMQMLPATAKSTARSINVKYSKSRLTTDPLYSIRLGSAFLKKLIKKFGGSYVLTFAGYNAGPGRPPQWIKRFGDPRSSKIDPIDWIEAIPFAETRAYVQYLIGNLQAYEALIDGRKLNLRQDLGRG